MSRSRNSSPNRSATIAAIAALVWVGTFLSSSPHETFAGPKPVGPTQVDAPGITAEQSEPEPFRVGPTDVAGRCVDMEGEPIAGVQISMYRVTFDDLVQRLVQLTSTTQAGQFALRQVAPIEDRTSHFVLVATFPGRATGVRIFRSNGERILLRLPPAASLRGTVKDQQGKPIAGAVVYLDHARFFTLAANGIRNGRTDANGDFEISDLSPDRAVDGSDGPPGSAPTRELLVDHPQFSQTRLDCPEIPGRVDIVLKKGGMITGELRYADTGAPAPGMTLAVQRIRDQDKNAVQIRSSTQTSRTGRFRVRSLPEGKFIIWISGRPKGLTAVAFDAVQVHEGETVRVPPMWLIRCGLVQGRLIDEATAKPATLKPRDFVEIGVRGPSCTLNGTVVETADVKPDGSFELRLAPGKNYVSVKQLGPFSAVFASSPSARPLDLAATAPRGNRDAAMKQRGAKEMALQEVLVTEGGTSQIEFYVKRPERAKGDNGNSAATEKPGAGTERATPKLIRVFHLR